MLELVESVLLRLTGVGIPKINEIYKKFWFKYYNKKKYLDLSQHKSICGKTSNINYMLKTPGFLVLTQKKVIN